MKKLQLLIIGLIILLGASPAHAEFRWGPSVGVNLSTLKFKQDLFKVSQSVGPTLGVQGELMFPGIGFGMDVSAFYSQMGASEDLGVRHIWAIDGYGKERSYLHFLEIPINLRFKWTRMNGFEDYLAPYVFGGPVFDFLVLHNDLKAMNYAGCSIGLQCGVGFEIKRRWQVQGSYMWGMTYTAKMAKLMDDSARNRCWTVRVAYLF